MVMAAVDPQFHVLAVDDSVIDRKLIERLLKTSSYHVTTVDSGSKALEFLGCHDYERCSSKETFVSPRFQQEVEVNLVITDYCMPGMTGYDLLKKIKESSSLRNIPVVIMSSENVPSRINRCLEEGAEEFFLKPVRISDVKKLRPHIIKNKSKFDGDDIIIQKPEKEEKMESIVEESTEEENIHLKSEEQSSQKQEETISTVASTTNNSNSSNKRKTVDEGLSPDARTRARYNNGVTVSVMSN